MTIWSHWWNAVVPLRAACSRQRTFLWLAVALAGFCTRGDLLGVSSTVRTLGLAERCYGCLLDFFHSPAVDLDCLTRLWARHSLKLFSVHRVGARAVLLGDGIKIAKSGRKMPPSQQSPVVATAYRVAAGPQVRVEGALDSLVDGVPPAAVCHGR